MFTDLPFARRPSSGGVASPKGLPKRSKFGLARLEVHMVSSLNWGFFLGPKDRTAPFINRALNCTLVLVSTHIYTWRCIAVYMDRTIGLLDIYLSVPSSVSMGVTKSAMLL